MKTDLTVEKENEDDEEHEDEAMEHDDVSTEPGCCCGCSCVQSV